MLPERLGRSSRIALFERVDDRGVLGEDVLEVAARPRRPEVHNADEAPQLAQEALDDRHAGSCRDPQMELLVEVDEVVLLLGVRRPLLSDQEEAQVVDVVERHPLGGAADRERLERLADVDDLAAVLGAEAADDELAARADLEQALAAQELERLPHRRLRDAELLGSADSPTTVPTGRLPRRISPRMCW